jgi:hypothetical protein
MRRHLLCRRRRRPIQVAVIERYQAAQAAAAAEGKQDDAASGGGGGGGGGGSSGDISNALLNIGFISPVTKGTAGTQYHEQLARQLADFLGGGRRCVLILHVHVLCHNYTVSTCEPLFAICLLCMYVY